MHFSLFVPLGCGLLDLFVGNMDWAKYKARFYSQTEADRNLGLDERKGPSSSRPTMGTYLLFVFFLSFYLSLQYDQGHLRTFLKEFFYKDFIECFFSMVILKEF